MKTFNAASLTAAAAALVASLFAFAVTRNGEAYVSVSHMGGLAYLHPLLALIGLVIAILAISSKMDGKYATTVIGALLLGLSVFLAGQAQSQLDFFVRNEFKMRADREWFGKNIEEREKAYISGTDPGEFKRPTLVIPDEYLSTYGLGFYLSLMSGGVLLACGLFGIARGKTAVAAATAGRQPSL